MKSKRITAGLLAVIMAAQMPMTMYAEEMLLQENIAAEETLDEWTKEGEITEDIALSDSQEPEADGFLDEAAYDEGSVREEDTFDGLLIEDENAADSAVEDGLIEASAWTASQAEDESLLQAASAAAEQSFTIYYLSPTYKDYLTLPADLPAKAQMTLPAGSKVTYYGSVDSSAEKNCYISENGEITPRSVKEAETVLYDVTYGGTKHRIQVTVLNYADIYAMQKLQAFADSIPKNISGYEKLVQITAYVAHNFDYSTSYASAISMQITGSGECWASTDMICVLCDMVGLTENSWRSASDDGGAGSAHTNALVKIGDDYYIAEAGFSEPKPRNYYVSKLSSLFSFKRLSDGTYGLQQFNGFDSVIEVPDNYNGAKVTEICDLAFYKSAGCRDKLTEVKLPKSVKHLGEEILYSCSAIKTFTIPAGVTQIDEKAFEKAVNLENIYVEAGNARYESVDGVLYDKQTKTLIAYPCAKKGKTYTVKAGTKRIGAAAFAYAKELEELILPAGVEEIGQGAVRYSSVIKISLPEGLRKIEVYGLNKTNSLSFEEIVIPSTVKEIQENAVDARNVVILSKDAVLTKYNAIQGGNFMVYEGSKAEQFMKENNRKYFLLNANGKADLKNDWFDTSSVTGSNYMYDGTEKKPYVRTSYKAGNPSLMLNKDYTISYENNINAGTAYVVIKGIGCFAGTIRVPYTIKAKALYYVRVDVKDGTYGTEGLPCYTYTGKPCEPEVVVGCYGNNGYTTDPASEGITYKVTYQNNAKPGRATAVVTFTGNYSGEYTEDYLIKEDYKTQIRSVENATNGLRITWKTTSPTSLPAGTVFVVERGMFFEGYGYSRMEKVASTTAMTWTDTTAVYGQEYYYKVTAMSEDGAKTLYPCEENVGGRWEFMDVPYTGKYYSAAVYWAAKKNITKGYKEDNTFRPQAECTRGQMVTFLWRLSGSPDYTSWVNPTFTDVKKTDYYYKAVTWAWYRGIVKGYSEDNTFRPNDACMREHAAMFLWRCAGKPEPATKVNPFRDVKQTDYYYKAVLWASEKKIANGYNEDRTYRPKNTCLREHIVTFMYRFNNR